MAKEMKDVTDEKKPRQRGTPKGVKHHEMREKKMEAPEKAQTAGVTPRARKEMYEQFRQHTRLALDRLVGILEDEKADTASVIAAAKEILSRGWGAVPQHHVIEAVFQHQHVINTDALRQMPQEQLTQLELTLARLVAPVEDAEVVETTDP